MPYDYLSINEQDLTYGIVSASYFTPNLQSLYEQNISNSQKFFGDNEDDIIELSLYNSNQEPINFNRIVPKVTYSVIEGDYKDINGQFKNYSIKNPFTNYALNFNELLLHTQFDLKINELNPGLYYTLYNPIRNIAGNTNYRLFIKEISPSRNELRLSFAFNTTTNESSRLNAIKISSFANKKFVFLQIIDELLSIINNNPVEVSFVDQSINYNYVKCAQLLGFKTVTELQEFITIVNVGFNKTINTSIDSVVIENLQFVGVAEQLRNFIYTYNETQFTNPEILEAIKIIVTKVSQDAILQRTTLTNVDLIETLNLFIGILYDSWLNPQVSQLLSDYSEKYFSLYKNALNFDNGNLVKILTHTSYVNPVDGSSNIQIKLDSPLPLQYSLKDTCWISNISLAPIYFKVNLYSAPLSKKVYLNGVNFTVDVPSINPTNDKLSNYNQNTLFSAETRLKQKINDLLIDYNNFSNFVNFSSAELRTKIAKNKITKYNSLNSSRTSIQNKTYQLSLNPSSQLNLSLSSSYSKEHATILQEQINLLDSFDDYESYLFYNTSSIDTNINSAVEYDATNYNSLIYQLPEYIKTSSDYEDYIKFTAMVGHFFDNILVFIKKFPKTYPLGYKDTDTYPKNYIEELLNSFGWDITTNIKLNESSINQLYFNNTEKTGSLSSSYFDYAKSIFNRIGNNLNYVYKTKGTSTSFDLMRSIFGVDADLINVVEYVTPNVLVNTNIFYDFDNVIYALKYDDNQYVKFDFKNPDYKLFLTSQWTSGSTSISGAIQITRSYIEKFTGVSTIEGSFRIKNYYKYNPNEKIPLIKKLRNNKIDWQIYLLKTIQEQSAKLVFDFHPKESLFTSSIKTKELPYLNGDFYTFMVKRESDANLVYDSNELSVNSNMFTQSLTSSVVDKYAPNIYTLSVNQYYGSQLNFTDTQNKTILYAQNQYFSSGSYYLGNFSSSIQFNGNLDKIKIQKLPLSIQDFQEHSYNINSISIPNKASVYNNLYNLWSFDTPVNLYNSSGYTTVDNQNSYYNTKFYAYNFARLTKQRGHPHCDTILYDKFPYQFEKINIKQALNSNNYGPNYKSNSNILKITQQTDSNLIPYDYSTYTNTVLGSDSNLVGYFISPYRYLNDKIEDFLGKEGITGIIGDPKYLNEQNYPELKTIQKDFSELSIKYIYPQESYSTYKFYIDFSIFDFVTKLVPARSTFKKGLLIEPSILERKKFNYKDIIVDTIVPQFSSSLIQFDIKPKFKNYFTDTNNTSSNVVLNIKNLNDITDDHDTYNYSTFEIKDRIDDRDFIYCKYGKYINLDSNGLNIRNTINFPTVENYQLINNNGQITTFSSSYNTVQIIGSGSGLLINQITGSNFLRNYYYGTNGDGYSSRHLSKFKKIGTRDRKQIISSLYNNKIIYSTYIKGQNTSLTTVNRKGLPNGSSPIISIPGFLSVDIESDNFTKYGFLTGSIQYPNSLFVQLPLTCSTCISASLNTYIMNL